MLSLSARSFVVVQLFTSALAATYLLSDNIQGSGFLSKFNVESIPDPTHGRVNYVDYETAARQNLTYASNDHFVMRADSETVLRDNDPGRNSVRLLSKKRYTTSVMIFNIRHMPQGCGTWPAVWTVGDDWPHQGEIDILEGVNDYGPNKVTLHTGEGCTMPESRSQTGTTKGTNCDVAETGNESCGVLVPGSESYGPSFNGNGGGWYAVERTDSFIKAWFWSRTDSGIPYEVQSGVPSVDTDNWGMPAAFFPSTNCPISEMFGPHKIAINLAFCGDWAGSSEAYATAGCPSSCVDFVNNNPSAFRDAYFDFAWLNIYQ
ncbi:glycoside hydrolase family 16 protein [Hebeloma cylindrosporum]|uniref:Glycoside hydrolase family 16 protein n=1 Tax=Hebeloma cylindrosporum TaxID=76867 RepID=A0A0C3CSB2_HEBCY|nr:glycoside hydrolase family 16 protein [Hebeloma cylindrosporum h7]